MSLMPCNCRCCQRWREYPLKDSFTHEIGVLVAEKSRLNTQLAQVTKERDEARERIGKLEKVREIAIALIQKDLYGVGEHESVICDRLIDALTACEEKEPTGE